MNELEKLSLLTEVLVGCDSNNDTNSVGQESEVVSEESVKEVPHGHFHTEMSKYLKENYKQILTLDSDFYNEFTHPKTITIETREADSNHIKLKGKIVFILNLQECINFNETTNPKPVNFEVILVVKFQNITYKNSMWVIVRSVKSKRVAHINSFECVNMKTKQVINSQTGLNEQIGGQ